MKTVGEIIHAERVKKDISLERLSSLTKIDIKYLKFLESNDFSKLPSETFIKGFIRNISHRLDRDPDELVAIFRRDYRHEEKGEPLKPRFHTSYKSFIGFNKALPFIVGLLVFLVYLGFQFRVILTPPKLTIQKPLMHDVVNSPVEIEGETTVDAVVGIGGELKVNTDESGHFSAKLSLPIGETNLQIKSTNRFGRSTTKSIAITVISK